MCKIPGDTLYYKTKTIKPRLALWSDCNVKKFTLKNCIARNDRFNQSESITSQDIIYKYMIHFRFCLQDIRLYCTHKCYW